MGSLQILRSGVCKCHYTLDEIHEDIDFARQVSLLKLYNLFEASIFACREEIHEQDVDIIVGAISNTIEAIYKQLKALNFQLEDFEYYQIAFGEGHLDIEKLPDPEFSEDSDVGDSVAFQFASIKYLYPIIDLLKSNSFQFGKLKDDFYLVVDSENYSEDFLNKLAYVCVESFGAVITDRPRIAYIKEHLG